MFLVGSPRCKQILVFAACVSAQTVSAGLKRSDGGGGAGQAGTAKRALVLTRFLRGGDGTRSKGGDPARRGGRFDRSRSSSAFRSGKCRVDVPRIDSRFGRRSKFVRRREKISTRPGRRPRNTDVGRRSVPARLGMQSNSTSGWPRVLVVLSRPRRRILFSGGRGRTQLRCSAPDPTASDLRDVVLTTGIGETHEKRIHSRIRRPEKSPEQASS